MAKIHPALEAMLAAWNEREPSRVRGHLDKALAHDVEFCDPANHIRGIDAFDAMVHAFRKDFPRAVCAHTSGFDSHHGRYRYEWTVSQDGGLVVPGMDVTQIGADGKIMRVDGFFGPFPKA